MKALLIGLVTLGSISTFASDFYIPKGVEQENQLVEAAQQTLRYVSVKSYEGQSNKKINKKLQTFMDKQKMAATVSFMINADSERFVSCRGRVVHEISDEMLSFESESYDGLLSEVLEINPDAKAPLVLMGCMEYSTDVNELDGDFVGRIAFEIEQNGNIRKVLKD